MRWIDALGNLYPGGRVTKMAWVWSKVVESDPVESPALRLWVSSKLPPDWSPRRITADGATIAEAFQPGDTQTLAIDVRSTHATIRFEFVDKNNNAAEMDLTINISVSRPYILVRPECTKNDIKFMVHKADARHLFVGLGCVDFNDAFDLYFFRSKDSSWAQGEGLVQFDPQNKFTAFKYHVAKPKEQVVYQQRLFRVGTRDDQQAPTEYSVMYFPKVRPSRFYLNLGLGTTIYNYKEGTGTTASQISLTGKTSFGFRLIPRVMDIAFNVFANLLTLTRSVKSSSDDLSGAPEARYYGFNGRLGYRLPLDLGATEFMFLTGYYIWNMFVADKSYGITNLNGPQIFVTMLNSQAGHRGYWLYFKYAMIAEKFTLNPKNNELAIGGGYELSPRESKPFALTLDIARVNYANPQNSLSLLSFTAGVQRAL